MKLTFLVPPSFDGRKPAERTAGCTRVVYLAPNIYELTVMAVLENAGYDVRYRNFIYKEETTEAFEDFIANDESDVYFFWTVNLSIDNDLLAVDIIRRRHPRVNIVFLGPGPTYFTSKCLRSASDIVVRGEPEQTVCELMEAFSTGSDLGSVAGISYLDDGRMVATAPRPLMKNLDSLPFPARHFIADMTFRNPKLKTGPYTTAVTSRNCPFHCIYCVPSSLTFAREIEHRRLTGHKPPISFRSPESVDREMAELAAAGYRAVGFMDDNFIWNEERTRAICDIMKRHDLVWGCEARVDAITEPIAEILGSSGCRYIDLGVESFDDRILAYIKKGITSADIYRAIALLKKYKVPVKLNVLIGSCPLETKDTLRHTLREAKRLDVDQVMFNIVSPFPGTEFYTMAKENGWLATPDYVPTDVQRESILNFPELSARDMERILYRNNISFFFSPRLIWRQMKRFRSWGEFTSALRALRIKLWG